MSKVIKLLAVFVLILGIAAIVAPLGVMAQEPTPTPTPTAPPPSLTMKATYPKLEINSTETATFEVQLNFTGSEKPLVFDLVATAPKDWSTKITPQYPTDRKIASVELTPDATQTILVSATPTAYPQQDPGQYPVTVVATSGGIRGSMELQAVITAKYSISMVPTNQLLNTAATAGKDNYYSIAVQNLGTSTVNNIALSSDKPQDWSITFTPEKIDSLTAGNVQTVDVNIKPPSKAIAGDYLITLYASGKESTAQNLQVRVTVETPTIWGVVGIIIVVVVIVGLAFTFRQFSRR